MWECCINAPIISMTWRQEKIKDIYQSIFISSEKTVVVAKLPCYLEQALGRFKQNIKSITFLCFLQSLSSWEMTVLLWFFFLDNGFLPFFPLLVSWWYIERILKKMLLFIIQSWFSFEYLIPNIKCLSAIPKLPGNTWAIASMFWMKCFVSK